MDSRASVETSNRKRVSAVGAEKIKVRRFNMANELDKVSLLVSSCDYTKTHGILFFS